MAIVEEYMISTYASNVLLEVAWETVADICNSSLFTVYVCLCNVMDQNL